jgi:transcriptional regulator with GAF, ATPase, and Fis domain
MTMKDQLLADVFVELADTLVDDFDLMDFLHRLTVRCTEVLGVAATGLLLADQRGALQVVAASTERARVLELIQLQTDEGPCAECFHTGQPVVVADLATLIDRWPAFVTEARQIGYASVHALPMRRRADVIGTLSLFGTQTGALDGGTVQLGQALADVATIGLLQSRAIRDRDALAEQLQTALNTRIIIEQAKGVIAERHGVPMEQAFAQLRRSARDGNRRLSELARAVVDGAANV